MERIAIRVLSGLVPELVKNPKSKKARRLVADLKELRDSLTNAIDAIEDAAGE